MISRHFFAWAKTTTPGERAEGVSSLVQDFLHMDLTVEERLDVESILTVLLEDPSIPVRRAMAEGLARATAAPHHVIVGLANDQPEVAAVVLGRSPVLSSEELIECARVSGAAAQIAIADRAELPAAVGSAIAETGTREAVLTLARNGGAALTCDALATIVQRFGQDGEVREAILRRPEVPAVIRLDLSAAVAASLSQFALETGWLSIERCERVTRESREKVAVLVAADAAEARGPVASGIARRLRVTGALTPGLLLRALLSGDRSLFESALCELSGLPFAKVAGLIGRPDAQGFHALYQRAGLPIWLLPAFQAAIEAQARHDCTCDENEGAHLLRPLVDHVLGACSRMTTPEAGKLIALLRRFQAEAARDAVRRLALPSDDEGRGEDVILDLPVHSRRLLAA